MNKNDFLAKLESSLKRLPDRERQDILNDFEEYFENGLIEGKTEENIAQSLGSPQQIAKELLAEYHIDQMENSHSTSNVLKAIWAVIGLGFFNLIIVLGPFIAIVALLFAGWIVGISFSVMPILVLLNTFVYPSTFEIFEFFFSLFLSGVGIFVLYGMFSATKWMRNIFIKYLKYNVNMVKGGLKHA